MGRRQRLTTWQLRRESRTSIFSIFSISCKQPRQSCGRAGSIPHYPMVLAVTMLSGTCSRNCTRKCQIIYSTRRYPSTVRGEPFCVVKLCTNFSPIPDFDGNQDSPVELLHVVLLGVVKYWWRDAVSRLTSDQKAILKTRLSSFEVSGLSAHSSRLRGHTLVQYAGSLVGRDFRIILQVAPAVLRGLLPDTIYEAWLALCRMAPLLYQPKITNINDYLVRHASRDAR